MAIEYKQLEQRDGVTAIVGHWLWVYDIFDMQRQGTAPAEIATKCGLSLVAVYEALAYAAGHPQEMVEAERQDREAYDKEVGELRTMLDARYDDLVSGRVKAIDGAEFARQMQEKSRELRARRNA